MSNTQYNNGRKLEYAAQEALEAEGYWTMRSPGSKGAVDVLGLKMGLSLEVLFVQCKLDGYLTPVERGKLLGLAAQFGATPLAARWHKNGRAARRVAFTSVANPGVELAWSPDHGLEVIP